MAQHWILRKGSKQSGFRYVTTSGRPVRGKDQLERIDALRIPPAWREVHIAVSPRATLQAWGLDARGRKQYRYHARAVEKGELSKHYRVRLLGKDLPRLRYRLRKDLEIDGLPKRKVCAGIVLLISNARFRVGSERYERENNTFGITTLRKSHVKVMDGAVRFEYRGKRGIRQWQFLESDTIAEMVSQLLKTPGQRLFRYKEEGKWHNVDALDVNEYIEDLVGFPYTAKDFRTWAGTLLMATVLAELGKAPNERARKKTVVSAIRMVAADLGNTPAICRKSYIHPVLISRYLKNGSTIVVRSRAQSPRASSRFKHSPEEKALIAFLARHFPERRKKRRTE